MQYSTIRSAGLVALVFALTISLVSAAPTPPDISLARAALIPATAPGLPPRSNPSLNHDGRPLEILPSGRMSTLPLATRLISRVRYSFKFVFVSTWPDLYTAAHFN